MAASLDESKLMRASLNYGDNRSCRIRSRCGQCGGVQASLGLYERRAAGQRESESARRPEPLSRLHLLSSGLVQIAGLQSGVDYPILKSCSRRRASWNSRATAAAAKAPAGRLATTSHTIRGPRSAALRLR